jgi:hypothetical protein
MCRGSERNENDKGNNATCSTVAGKGWYCPSFCDRDDRGHAKGYDVLGSRVSFLSLAGNVFREATLVFKETGIGRQIRVVHAEHHFTIILTIGSSDWGI